MLIRPLREKDRPRTQHGPHRDIATAASYTLALACAP